MSKSLLGYQDPKQGFAASTAGCEACFLRFCLLSYFGHPSICWCDPTRSQGRVAPGEYLLSACSHLALVAIRSSALTLWLTHSVVPQHQIPHDGSQVSGSRGLGHQAYWYPETLRLGCSVMCSKRLCDGHLTIDRRDC